MTDALLRDSALTAELETVKAAIVAWATKHGLWYDAGFKIPFEHRNEAPREGEVLYMHFDGPLHSVFNPESDWADELGDEFRIMLDGMGFWCELEDHVTLNITPHDAAKQHDFLRLHRWQWIQKLSERRLYDFHSEVFEHFASNKSALQDLHWRQFEEVLDSVFRNQGFRTELGPGGDDGGIDIRLYQSESIPEIVTLVQAKKYKGPIKLEPVAALAGIAQMERAQRALFVTSSRYQPKARDFALNTHGRLDMPHVDIADGSRVGEWCASISKQLNDYFLSGETRPPPILRAQPQTELTGKIVVASHGYNTTWNTFAVIEADYPYEVILRPIGSKVVAHDGYGQRGTEVADIAASPGRSDRGRILAFKNDGDGRPYYWGDRKLFTLWDGTPRRFDYCD